MDLAEWWSPYLDGKPGLPIELVTTATDMTWCLPLPELAMVIVLHGSKDYLGCSVRRQQATSSVR